MQKTTINAVEPKHQTLRRALAITAAILGFWNACAHAADVSAAGNRWIPDKVAVDTLGPEHEYNPPVSDGYRVPRYWNDAWLSREDHFRQHWVALSFTSPVPVEAVAIHWALDNNHPKASGAPTTSRSYRIQAAQNGVYRDIVTVDNSLPVTRSVHTFERVTTDRIRIFQPPGGGPVMRTNAMWLAEVEIYDYPKTENDFGTPADREEVRRARAAMRARTIGIYPRRRRTRHTWSTSIGKTLEEHGWRTIFLDQLDERDLQRSRVVVLTGEARHIPNREKLLHYLHGGGSVLFVHNAAGHGGGGSLLPDLWEFAGHGEGELRIIDSRHPISADIAERFESEAANHVRLRAGRRGKALVRDEAGYDVAVAGNVGSGRAAALGLGRMRELRHADAALLINTIEWLKTDAGIRYAERPSRALRRDLRRLEQRYRPIFEDVTEAAGVAYSGYAKGTAMADINHNGRLDVFSTVIPIHTADPYHNLLFRNDGDWRFTEIAAGAGVTGPPGIGTVFGDVTGDGNLDLWVSWMPEIEYPEDARGVLYRGDGLGGFRDVTDESGLGDTGMTAVCMMADVNNNGHLDLYLVGYRSNNKLYINRGDGTFDDRTEEYGLAGIGSEGISGYGGGLAAAMADLDHNGFVDLAVFSHDRLRIFRNENGKRFVEVTDYMGHGIAPVEGGSLGIALGDINNNGRLDIFAGGPNVLLRNDGNMRFTDITVPAGLKNIMRGRPYGQKFVDWNNSGRLDLYISNPGSLALQNNGDETFTDVTATLGLDVFAVHGFNFGDLEGDGDLDFYATSWLKYPFVLLRNNTDDGNAMTVRARGTQSNTSGVGAKIWVYDESEADPERRLRGYREVKSGGGSMYSGGILQQHIGLGPGGGPYTVETLFPVSGERVTVSNVTPHRILTIVEPAGNE